MFKKKPPEICIHFRKFISVHHIFSISVAENIGNPMDFFLVKNRCLWSPLRPPNLREFGVGRPKTVSFDEDLMRFNGNVMRLKFS